MAENFLYERSFTMPFHFYAELTSGFHPGLQEHFLACFGLVTTFDTAFLDTEDGDNFEITFAYDLHGGKMLFDDINYDLDVFAESLELARTPKECACRECGR